MSSILENEIMNNFIKALITDESVPAELSKAISVLHDQDKLSTGTHLKKIIEDFTPTSQGVSNEDK